MLCSLVSKRGNLILNVGPAADGTIPVIMEERLRQIGDWLKINGDAIYATRAYTKKEQNGTYYTKSKDGKKVYAIINRFPFGSVTLDEVEYNSDLKARLLSHDSKVTITDDNGKACLNFESINPDEMKCKYLYAVELCL